MCMIIWYNQQEPLNFMIMMGMAQERGSKGPQKWLAGILEPHPSGIPSSFCSWSASNLWCISLGCLIFRLFWEDPWFQKRTSLVRTWIQPSNVTSSGSMGKSLGRRCGDSRAAMAAIGLKMLCQWTHFWWSVGQTGWPDLLPGGCLCKHTALSQWGSFPHIRRGQSWQWWLLLPRRRSDWSGDWSMPIRPL